ncbi:MAG: hypothetical protein JXA21_29405 [Anaerolineae bacterium]|nr:hypothetical protein [Anaerolineae bacterium]
MVVFELKLLIFVGLLLLLGVAAGWEWMRWAGRRQVARGPADPSLVSMLDAAPFGLLVLDGAQALYANRYAQRLLHLSGAGDELPDSDWLPLLESDRAVAHKAQSGTGQYRNVTFASGQTARWWVTAWERDGLLRECVFLLDITAQQRTEQAGRALVNDLAHELRTPLATILTHLEILGLSDVGGEVRAQSLALAQDEAHRMNRLLQDMLELGRLETASDLPRRPLNLADLVEGVVLQSTPQAAERQMTLSLEAASPLPLVNGDPDRLRQVFLNLLDNAFKYARPGDSITIALESAPGGSGSAPGVACSICDTGPGIPPEHLPHITRRFYRAAPKSIAGSGLGLSLVSEILRRHESSLTVESPVADGRGTCVRFVLPQAGSAQNQEGRDL